MAVVGRMAGVGIGRDMLRWVVVVGCHREPVGYGAVSEARNLIDETIATLATRIFATITGSE